MKEHKELIELILYSIAFIVLVTFISRGLYLKYIKKVQEKEDKTISSSAGDSSAACNNTQDFSAGDGGGS